MLSSFARRSLEALLPHAAGFERSWSFGSTGAGMASDTAGRFDRRGVLFLPATAEAVAAICDAGRALGMTQAGTEAFRRALPQADAIGLGIAQSGSVRLYLQYWERIARRVRAGNRGNALLYLGIKEYPGGLTRTDRYICRPLAPQSLYQPVIGAALRAFGCPDQPVQALLRPLTPERCIWTAITNPARRSWLATIRRADIPAQALAAALRPLGTPGAGEIVAALEHGKPLHIAGGKDDRKGSFLTLYVSTDAAGLQAFLEDMPRG